MTLERRTCRRLIGRDVTEHYNNILNAESPESSCQLSSTLFCLLTAEAEGRHVRARGEGDCGLYHYARSGMIDTTEAVTLRTSCLKYRSPYTFALCCSHESDS